MKKTIFHITSIIILAISCKKDTQPASPKSQWTFGGSSYKGFAKSYPLGGEFSASDDLNAIGLPIGNIVAINFLYGHWPATSGIYKVKENPGNSTECKISVGYMGTAGANFDYTSVDSTSEVSVTVSSTGRLSASFSNVVVSNYARTETKTVSGTLEEQ